MSRLNEANILAACERDVPGVFNMLIFSVMNDQKATIMDLVHFDQWDESVNMCHCGVAAGRRADKNSLTWDVHCILIWNIYG
ncbi:MAG: hypothetical protein ACM3YE_14725 [Bacteroidota bacterium]